MLAVAMLMADDGFDATLRQKLSDLEALACVQRHRLFESDQTRAALDADANHLAAQVGKSAEAEDVGLHRGRDPERVRAFDRAEFGCGRIEAGRIDVADADHFEAAVRLKSLGMVHSALAHAHDHDPVLAGRRYCRCRCYCALLSHSRTLSMV